MTRTISVFLSASPYAYGNTLSAIRIIEASMNKGHLVNLIATGDGVFALMRGQKYKGVPDAEGLFSDLIAKGLEICLCGGCLSYRRVAKKGYIKGVKIIKAKACMKIIEQSDIWINL